jgi:putative ABC transport system permease protein
MRTSRSASFQTSFGRVVKLAVRSDADPRALVAPVRGAIANIDSQLAIESLETMDERVREVVAPRRFSVMTLGGFAAGSLLLAAIGLYGLLAFNVAERRRELAIRLALGAEPLAIRRLVVGQGLALVGIGLGVGAAVSFAIARTVASLLYQTPSHDVVTFSSVPVVLLLVSLVACALPAYRASRVEAASALRAE